MKKIIFIIIVVSIFFTNDLFAEKKLKYQNDINSNFEDLYSAANNNSILYKVVNGKTYPHGVLGVSTSSYSENYSYDDFYWLSRIIHAESKGESYKGKLAVGNVVVNRVNSKHFPDTIKEVIFEKNKNIYQFTPVATGAIINNPSEESKNAARAVLEGEKPVKDALFFLNPNIASSKWIVNERKFIKKIGNHAFYE